MALSYGFNLDAVGTQYTSAQFSEMFYQLLGDSVAKTSMNLSLTIASGLKVTLNPGFLYVAGRWARLTESITFTLAPSYSGDSRYDAIAAVANYQTREVTLEALTDIDPDSPARDANQYQAYLYIIEVPRAATALNVANITDNRSLLDPLANIYSSILEVYDFTTSGIEERIAEIMDQGDEDMSSANQMIAQLTNMVENSRDVFVGDIREAAVRPTPNNEWLACNGAAIPVAYTELRSLIGASMPTVSTGDSRMTAWMYAGTPAS